MICFNCPNCDQAFTIADEHGGKKSRCPKCKQVVTIPDEPNPLFDVLAALDQPATGLLRTYEPPEPTKSCPYCAEKILAVAVKCKYCGASLNGGYRAVSESASQPRSTTDAANGRSHTKAKGIAFKIYSIIGGVLAFLVIINLLIEFEIPYPSFNSSKKPDKKQTRDIQPDPAHERIKTFLNKTQELVKEARKFETLREVGGNYQEHKNALIALRTAIKSAPYSVDSDSKEFLEKLKMAAEEYSEAIEYWSRDIQSSYRSFKTERDFSFTSGDVDLLLALSSYKSLEWKVE